MINSIYVADTPKENEFLRKKTVAFDFKKHSKKEIADLLRNMRKTMKAANGIGLAANQIGLPYRMFVAEVESSDGAPKFYALFNPEFEKLDAEKDTAEEGCLSVPGAYGDVARPGKVTLTGQDRNGKKLRIKAWGLLARVFQHEMDHLEGKLFIDRSKNVTRAAESERLLEREGKLARK
jgi:peptide deformylase